MSVTICKYYHSGQGRFGSAHMRLTQCLSGVMRGAGDTTTPMWLSMFTSAVLRIPLAYGMVERTKTPELPQGNCAMMYVSLLITWTVGAVLTCVVCRLGRWKRKAVLG